MQTLSYTCVFIQQRKVSDDDMRYRAVYTDIQCYVHLVGILDILLLVTCCSMARKKLSAAEFEPGTSVLSHHMFFLFTNGLLKTICLVRLLREVVM